MESISEKTRGGRWFRASGLTIALAVGGCLAETDASEDDAVASEGSEDAAEAAADDDVEVEGSFAALAATSPSLYVGSFGYEAGGWRVDRHPRFAEDVTGDGRADIVGFGEDGVWVAPANGASFSPLQFWLPWAFAASGGAGGWSVANHPRFLADVNGDRRKDIVGFGNDAVWVSLSTGTGFTPPSAWLWGSFGYNAGGWRVDKHPRFLADVNADGRADIVGFGNDAVWVSLSTGGGFTAPRAWVSNYGYVAGGWRVEKHPRFLADVNGDRRADVVGFGNAGVYVSIALATRFAEPMLWNASFGHDAGGWRVEKHPRYLADVNGDGRQDVVGFGDAGVWVARSTGAGFLPATRWIATFGHDAGNWRVPLHVRVLGDINGDGRADVVGFGDAYTWAAVSTGSSFGPLTRLVGNYSLAQGWQVARHPRLLARVDGNATADIVGFGNAGVYVSRLFP